MVSTSVLVEGVADGSVTKTEVTRVVVEPAGIVTVAVVATVTVLVLIMTAGIIGVCGTRGVEDDEGTIGVVDAVDCSVVDSWDDETECSLGPAVSDDKVFEIELD